MAKKTIETGESPLVVVEKVGSDLQVKGWDRLEVLVKSSSDNDITLEDQDDSIIVSCPSDCVLYIPQKASIEVKNIGSNARFRSISSSDSNDDPRNTTRYVRGHHFSSSLILNEL